MKRAANIDLCRGLLFVLMANTHALTIAGVEATHWLFSDLWLPSGWATQVFVVLSGFSVGFLCASRTDHAAVQASLLRRSRQIFWVMVGSNTFFAFLRIAMTGSAGLVFDPGWWFGFVTLDTPWTISGVLLPTALVVFFGVFLSRVSMRAPWLVLGALVAARLLVSALAVDLAQTPEANGWAARFFMLQGLGGFPVIPFVINGCFGVWLGVLRNRSHGQWRAAIVILLLLQLAVFSTSFHPPAVGTAMFVANFSAVGKFAWMYLAAYAVQLAGPWLLAAPIDLMGKFALGSFVMHRVFLQALIRPLSETPMPVELRYVLLVLGTLLLTWGLCWLRQRVRWIDVPFRRVAM